MSAAGLSATGSASASVYIPGPSSSSRRKSSTVSSMTCHINREFQHKFYIPGETPSGGPFPPVHRKLTQPSSLAIIESDGSLLTSDGRCGNPPEQDQGHNYPLSTVWSFIRGKVWGLVQNTFKKEARLSQTDIFNEACTLRLAAYYGNNKGRGTRQLEHLMKKTDFTKDELKLLYWGWKCTCPSGILSESNFKEMYAQFFPQAGDSSLYAHHVYRSMFGGKENCVTFCDYVVSLSLLLRGSILEKLEWTFKLYDINEDGQITLEELEEISKAIYSLLGYYIYPSYDSKTCDDHAARVFEKLDPQRKGFITKAEFIDTCSKDEMIVRSLQTLDGKGVEIL